MVEEFIELPEGRTVQPVCILRPVKDVSGSELVESVPILYNAGHNGYFVLITESWINGQPPNSNSLRGRGLGDEQIPTIEEAKEFLKKIMGQKALELATVAAVTVHQEENMITYTDDIGTYWIKFSIVQFNKVA